jgi:hypothetical protein
MKFRFCRLVLTLTTVLLAGCATCGPGTVQTAGTGWGQLTVDSVCLPVGTVSDCTDFQMVEEDGGGWRSDRDGGGWRSDRDGGGWRRERDEPHHPGDAGDTLATIYYVPTGVCRVGIPVPDAPSP